MSPVSPPFVTVPNRPFSTEIITGLMLPDGIFESALGNQRLNAHFRNEDANSISVNVYVESVSDPRFVVTPQTFNLNLPSGASQLFSWDVNISTVPPVTDRRVKSFLLNFRPSFAISPISRGLSRSEP